MGAYISLQTFSATGCKAFLKVYTSLEVSMLEAMVIEVCGTKASRRVTSIWNFEVELRESKVCHDTEDEDDSDQWRRSVKQNSGAQPVHDLHISVCLFCT